eukprot:4174103-Prymnesium_polylepis.1
MQHRASSSAARSRAFVTLYSWFGDLGSRGWPAWHRLLTTGCERCHNWVLRSCEHRSRMRRSPS